MTASQAREICGEKHEHQELIDEIKIKLVIAAAVHKQKELKIDRAFLPKGVIEYFKDLEYNFRKGRNCYTINWH